MKEIKETYNGWKNRQTWNIALWISNDEPLYRAARQYAIDHPKMKAIYMNFIKHEGMTADRTPDNISYTGTRLDYKALNDMMHDLI